MLICFGMTYILNICFFFLDSKKTNAIKNVEDEIKPNQKDNNCTKTNSNNTPRKRKMRAEIKRLRTQCSRLKKKQQQQKHIAQKKKIDNIINGLRDLLPKAQFEFFATQILLTLKKKKGYRWTIKDKNFALSIYYQSKMLTTSLGKFSISPQSLLCSGIGYKNTS